MGWMMLLYFLLFLNATIYTVANKNDISKNGIKLETAEINNRLLNMLQLDKINGEKHENITYKVIYAKSQVPNDVIMKISKVVNRNEPIHDALIRNYSDNDAALTYFWLMTETLFFAEIYNDRYRIRSNGEVVTSLVDYITNVDKNFTIGLFIKDVKDSEMRINNIINLAFDSGLSVDHDELIDRVGIEIVRLITLLVNGINLDSKIDDANKVPRDFLSKSFKWQFGIHDSSTDSNNDRLFSSVSSVNIFMPENLSNLSFRPEDVFKRILSTGFKSNFKGPQNIIRGQTLILKDIYDIFNIIYNLNYNNLSPGRIQNLFIKDVCRLQKGKYGNLHAEYLALPKSSIDKLIGEMHCVRAYLFMFGFPDSNGKLSFPYGWPRNIDYALADIISGQSSGCGLCYSLIGFLLAIGYPPVVNGYSGISVTNNGRVVQIVPPFSRVKIPPDVPFNSFKFSEERSGYDQPFISFVTGSNLGDSLSKLAHSYYLKSGFGHISNVYMGLPKSSHYSLHRPVEESPVKCLRAIPYVLDVARNSINSSNGDNWLHPDSNDSFAFTMSQNTHDMHNTSRYYAEFIKSIASEGNPDGIRALGELYYMGHDDGEISRDIVRALRIWGDAAESGDPVSALAVASVHLQSGSNNMASAEPFLKMVINDPKSTKEQTYLAKFYMARYGLGREKNPYEAGEYLLKAGAFGDIMTQMLIGHAYAGILVGVKTREGTNLYRALKHYKYAANAGSVVGKYNTAILTIQGYDLLYQTAHDRCNAAYPLLHNVAMKNSSVLSLLHMAKRAEILNDHTGALLGYMMLSEIGHPAGHVRSAKLWKYSKYDNNVSNPLVKKIAFTLFDKLTGGFVTSKVPLPQKEYYRPFVKYAIFNEKISPSGNLDFNRQLHFNHLLKSEYLVCFARPVSHYQKITQSENSINNSVTNNADVGAAGKDDRCLTGTDGRELCLFYYTRRAASRNDPDAMAHVANTYLTTKNWIMSDYSAAFKWASEAAKLGNSMGIYISARLFEKGLGVDRNCEMTIMYYKKLLDSSQLESKIMGFIMIWISAFHRFIYNLQSKIGFEIVRFTYEPCDPLIFDFKVSDNIFKIITVVSTFFSLISASIIYYIW